MREMIDERQTRGTRDPAMREARVEIQETREGDREPQVAVPVPVGARGAMSPILIGTRTEEDMVAHCLCDMGIAPPGGELAAGRGPPLTSSTVSGLR